MGTTCFACREKGHAAKDCPSNRSGGGKSKAGIGICYRYGARISQSEALTCVFTPDVARLTTRYLNVVNPGTRQICYRSLHALSAKV